MLTKISGFDWDEGNWPKCAKHGVSKAEIEYVLRYEPMVRPDRTGSKEPPLNAIGRNAMGRYLFIAFMIRTVDNQTMLRPISARYMHQQEVDHYEQG